MLLMIDKLNRKSYVLYKTKSFFYYYANVYYCFYYSYFHDQCFHYYCYCLNMCSNTLIRTIDNEKIKLMGYNYTNALSPHHWFQIADDTAVAIATVEDSQVLLNVFSKWCQWANFKNLHRQV